MKSSPPRRSRKKNLSVAESAVYLDRSTKTIRRYLKQGLLEYHMVRGNYGPEIRIPRKGLDMLLKRLSTVSKRNENPLKMLRLFREASPETQELVLKILDSGRQEAPASPRRGFGLSFFRKKGGGIR